MADIPITRENLLFVDESRVEKQNDQAILDSAELLDHLGIVNHSMVLVASILNQIPHTTDDELVVQRLIVRCLNSTAAALKLARAGYYQAALTMVRDLVETTFLLDLFNSNREEVKIWWSSPAVERGKRFAPWKVRKQLDDRDGNKEGLRGAAYRMLSTYAAHPTPEGFNMTSPGGMTQVGPFADKDRMTALLQELARNASYAALVIGMHTPPESDAAFQIKLQFLSPFNAWRGKYMPGGEDVLLEDFLKEVKAHGPS
jgi:hypothetical protein